MDAFICIAFIVFILAIVSVWFFYRLISKPRDFERLVERKNIKTLIKMLGRHKHGKILDNYRQNFGKEYPDVIREKACTALIDIGQESVPSLIAVLDSGNGYAKEQAIIALGELKSSQAVGRLSRLLDDYPDAAATALGKIGDPRAVDPLCEALPKGLSSIPEALAKIGDRRAVESLSRVLVRFPAEKKFLYFGKSIAEALRALGWHPEEDEVSAWYYGVKGHWNKVVALGETGLPVLIGALDSQFSYDRLDAAKRLGDVGATEACGVLVKTFNRGDVEEKIALLDVLQQIGCSELIMILDEALAKGQKDLREKAAWMLFNMDRPEANQVLRNYLHDKNESVQNNAIKAVSRSGDMQLLPIIREILAEKMGRVTANLTPYCFALGNIKIKAAVELLGSIMSRDISAVYALAKMGTQDARDCLLSELNAFDERWHSHKAAVISALGDLKEIRAVERLMDIVDNDHNPHNQVEAIQALAKIGDVRCLDLLLKLSKDGSSDDYHRQEYAVRALGSFDDPRSLKRLRKALADESLSVREAAADALDQLNWKPIKNRTGARYWAIRQDWEACVDLGHYAIVPLEKLCESRDAAVSTAARKTLRRIQSKE